jgi:Family of unknown function (DUF6152)
MQRYAHFCVSLSGLLVGTAANAHHSYVEFDDEQTIEIEGTLNAAGWWNPHTILEVQATDKAGRVTTWEIETSPLNRFKRFGVPLEVFAVGSTVKVAGWPSKRSPTRMYGTNLLSADGQEVVLWLAEPRWSRDAYGLIRPALASGPAASAAPTLFRLWTSGYAIPGQPDDPDASPGALWRGPLPFTEAAQQARASFDQAEQNRKLGCTPKGMPVIMNNPALMELVERADTILLRNEEYDTVRTIHMDGRTNADADAQPKTPLGYSTGRWDGKTLVVETSRVDERNAIPFGLPLGDSATFVERFTLSDDGGRLHYTIIVTDADLFTMPTELKRSWVTARPGAQLLPFNCTV